MKKSAKTSLKWKKEPRGWLLMIDFFGLAIKKFEDRFHGTISLVQKDVTGKIIDIWDVCSFSGRAFEEVEQRIVEKMKEIALEKIKALSVFLTDDELSNILTKRREK